MVDNRKIILIFICFAVICFFPLCVMAKSVTKAPARDWKLLVAQQKLELMGFAPGQPDGRMKAMTQKALKKFQQQYKLKASGKLDNATYKKITNEAFKKEGITGVKGADVVQTAAKYRGVPYAFGGTAPKGFDCSGYVQYVFARHKAVLPRTADVQARMGIFVLKKNLKAGDLVFFETYEKGASHVGIYAGKGRFWNASSSRGVVLDSLNNAYWQKHYYGARRVLVANGEAV